MDATPKAETANRLLIVIHHLAIDGVSWRILLKDLTLLLSKLVNGDKIDLAHKSSSYRQWYQALQNFSKGQQLLTPGKLLGKDN